MKPPKKIENGFLLSALKSANSVLLCTHIYPDGDAVGSLLAAGKILRRLGKHTTLACADAIPQKYRFLPGAEEIVRADALSGRAFDLGFALDAGDEYRLGDCVPAYRQAACRIVLDHHGTNPGYGQYNEIDAGASSTGCLVWRLMGELEMEPDKEIAECLYTAISSDTGNFCFSNTDEETFLCAAAMAGTGFDLNKTARRAHLVREAAHVRLLGRAIASLRIFADGKCACMRLTNEDYQAAGALPEHSDGIVNYALDLPGVVMAYLVDLRESTKFSFRAVAPGNVAEIAQKLGGGGHVLAAGCKTDVPPDEAIRLVEAAMLRQVQSMS